MRFICTLVSSTDSGTVTKNTQLSRAESSSSMTNDPATVKKLVAICKKSVEIVALTVSTS